MELKSAFRAPDHDMALASGDPDLLRAFRTFVDMIVLVLLTVFRKMLRIVFELARFGFEAAEVRRYFCFQLQELLVFPIASGDVPGEHAVIHIADQDQDDPPQDSGRQEEIDHDQDHRDRGDHLSQAVHTVSALHEGREFVAQLIQKLIHCIASFQNTLILFADTTSVVNAVHILLAVTACAAIAAIIYFIDIPFKCNEFMKKEYKKTLNSMLS